MGAGSFVHQKREEEKRNIRMIANKYGQISYE